MRKTKSQNGSAHVVIVVVLVIGIICALGFVFWKNILATSLDTAKTSKKTVSQQSVISNPKQAPTNPYDGWKTYTSSFGSGLTFKYPADWYIQAPFEDTNTGGGKENIVSLFSAKPQVVSQDGAPVTVNQFMCVSVSEYTGLWSTANENTTNPIKTEEFMVGKTTLELNVYRDNSLDRADKPMGNIMRLISIPPSSHGSAYIDSQNGIFFTVVAQYNCVQGGEGIKNLDTDYFSQPETKEAELILKSVSFKVNS